MSKEPGPGTPFDLPIRTSPEWLAPPTTGRSIREPWYYGFLEKYAKVLLTFGVLTFAAFAMVFAGPLLFPEVAASWYQSLVAPLFRQATVGPGGVVLGNSFTAFGGRLVVAVVGLGLAFFGGLLPILLTVAYILLSVDAGRNLREIRRSRAGG